VFRISRALRIFSSGKGFMKLEGRSSSLVGESSMRMGMREVSSLFYMSYHFKNRRKGLIASQGFVNSSEKNVPPGRATRRKVAAEIF
jgi:hypothetical protein